MSKLLSINELKHYCGKYGSVFMYNCLMSISSRKNFNTAIHFDIDVHSFNKWPIIDEKDSCRTFLITEPCLVELSEVNFTQITSWRYKQSDSPLTSWVLDEVLDDNSSCSRLICLFCWLDCSLSVSTSDCFSASLDSRLELYNMKIEWS